MEIVWEKGEKSLRICTLDVSAAVVLHGGVASHIDSRRAFGMRRAGDQCGQTEHCR